MKRSVTPGRDGWSPDQNHEPFTVGSRHTQSAVAATAGKPAGEGNSGLQRGASGEQWSGEVTNLRWGGAGSVTHDRPPRARREKAPPVVTVLRNVPRPSKRLRSVSVVWSYHSFVAYGTYAVTTKIYLDHNIIQYLARQFPPKVDAQRERTDFERMLAATPNVRFVISHWNIIEASRGTDEARVKDCASLIGRLRPLIVRDKSGMAREELRACAFAKFYDTRVASPEMFFERYADALTALGIDDPRVFNHTPEGDVLESFKNPHWFAPIAENAAATPDVLKTLANAKSDGLLTRDNREETTRSWFFGFFPLLDPAGNAIAKRNREQMVAQLAADIDEVYTHCPSLRVEDQLSELRISNKDREPRESDAIDLMMAVPSLAYCDAFVSYDGYVAAGAKELARRGVISCFVARLLSEVAAQFSV